MNKLLCVLATAILLLTTIACRTNQTSMGATTILSSSVTESTAISTEPSTVLSSSIEPTHLTGHPLVNIAPNTLFFLAAPDAVSLPQQLEIWTIAQDIDLVLITDVSWIALSKTSLTASPVHQTINVTGDSHGMSLGIHKATIRVQGLEYNIAVPVEFWILIDGAKS